jgi:hypothetical protein
MTIAIAIKVHDGIVLAADSAVTIATHRPDGGLEQVAYVYNNANKICNLVKGLPVGAMFWGPASIGPASMASVLKDLRQRMTRAPSGVDGWHVDQAAWQIGDIANRLKRHLDERIAAVPGWAGSGGALVAGHSVEQDLAESWVVEIKCGVVQDPMRVDPSPEEAYWVANGEPEAIQRLLLGIPGGLATSLSSGLKQLGVPDDKVASQVAKLVECVRETSQASVIHPAMPMQDAIELADFLASMTRAYSRFTPGAATVGGPIDLAAITKHEGFKWVRRKHYFDQKYNVPPQDRR